MARAAFQEADFIASARELAAEHGPAAVTVEAIVRRIGAPTGSFYHRFNSRETVLARVWLEAIGSYQQGFLEALEANDGLAAALHAVHWARRDPTTAALVLLHRRQDFLAGDWPAPLREEVEAQWRQVEEAVRDFAARAFGRANAQSIRRAQFALADIPIAAVRPHLARREPPPPIVDHLVTAAYKAVMEV